MRTPSRLSEPTMTTLKNPLSLEDLVSNTPDLPVMPAAVMAVIRETESSTCSAQSVAKYLSQDPALAVRVLRLANSAFYSLRRQIMEVPEAVVVLGMRTVRNLAMIAGSYPWMSRELKGYELGPRELWAHSFGVAIGAEVVARRARLNESEAFSAGLLHNLGKVAMSVWLESRAEALFDAISKDEAPFDAVERQVLGFDHMQAGAHMAESWNLPKPLVRAIRFHHCPDVVENPEPLVDCVHIADFMAMSAGMNPGWDGLRYEISLNAFERMKISPDDITSLMDEFLLTYSRHDKLFEEHPKAA